MRALGFLHSFDELADRDKRLGRKVANFGLASALLQYSSAEELHFFLPFQSAVGPFEQDYGHWLNLGGNRERVKLLPALRLPEAAAQFDYLAIHASELDRYFPELCHLRNRAGGALFPVTCTTHTLNYWHTQVRSLYKVFPGPRPYDSIFCTSRAAQEHLSQSLGAAGRALGQMGLTQAGYAGRLDIAPLGVEASQFCGISREAALAELGLEPGPLTLLYIGRLTAEDKCDLVPLIGVLALLSRKYDLRLVLAGAGNKKYINRLKETAAQAGAAGRLHIFENFDSKLKPALYAASDVFVSPSDNLQETFGLTILEAMAAARPVVASDFSGYRDLVEQGCTGYLIPTTGPGDYSFMDAAWPLTAERVGALQTAQRTAVDIDALISALDKLLEQPGLRESMGEAGRSRVLENFDWPVVVRRMEDLWTELKGLALAAGEKPAEPNVLGADLGRAFGHFVSGALLAGDVLTPGPLAPVFKEGVWAHNPYPDLAGLLPPELLEVILSAVEQSGGQAALGDLQSVLGAKIPAQMLEHLILHGLKYGVLSLKK